MIEPGEAPPSSAGGPVRRAGPSVIVAGYTSFIVIGWTGLLVPSLIRSIEHDFGQSDAGVAAYYFLYAVCYAAGGAAGGILTERLGRRIALPLAAGVLAAGLVLLAVAPAWPVFLAAGVPFALGAGAIDAAVNGLFLEIHPGRGGPLNLLHVFFSVGALVAPLVLGLLVASGIAWPAIVLASAAAALGIARLFAAAPLPAGRRQDAGERAASPPSRLLSGPILLLGAAIAAYIACEIGTSSWLVRFLSAAPIEVATGALSLFWAGLALGRLVASRVADSFPPIAFAAFCALAAGVAVVAAVLAPSLELSIALFGIAGLAQGPVYPMIMTIGGSLQPGRSGAVSGVLTASAVIGGIVYPPLIGVVSVQLGIGAGILGAGALGVASAAALVAAALVAGSRQAAST